MSDNLVRLDLSRFSATDRRKAEDLEKKVRLMRRWCRCEFASRGGREQLLLYSGDRGQQPYASFRIERDAGGGYHLHDGRNGASIAEGRTISAVIDALPDSFYYAKY